MNKSRRHFELSNVRPVLIVCSWSTFHVYLKRFILFSPNVKHTIPIDFESSCNPISIFLYSCYQLEIQTCVLSWKAWSSGEKKYLFKGQWQAVRSLGLMVCSNNTAESESEPAHDNSHDTLHHGNTKTSISAALNG